MIALRINNLVCNKGWLMILQILVFLPVYKMLHLFSGMPKQAQVPLLNKSL